MPQQINKRKFTVTWTAVGSKTVNEETIEATTRMEAQSTIRWRELANGTEIKDIKTMPYQEVA